jgi:hypothetical protein
MTLATRSAYLGRSTAAMIARRRSESRIASRSNKSASTNPVERKASI